MACKVLAAVVTLAAGSPDVPNVTLQDGLVVMGTSRMEGTCSYWGIRYGVIPTRFAAAVPWRGDVGTIIDGRPDDPTECWQLAGGLTPTGTEDCLFLDVTAPLVNSGESHEAFPTMVWIHGGGLRSGYKGAYSPDLLDFAREGQVAVVSLNYRLNVMGFFATIDGSVPANNGIRDQILALKWVQTNIQAFGGDPSRVTIWGQSAGALSVSVLLQSPLAKGLFHRAIAQSPAWQDAAQFQRPIADAAASLSMQCLQAVGCASLACLREANASDFQRCDFVAGNGAHFIGVQGAYFTGFDGEVVPSAIWDGQCRGEPPLSDVPVIVGNLPHEWRFFMKDSYAKFGGFYPNATVSKFLQEHLDGYAEGDQAQQECASHTLLQLYSGAAAFNTCPNCSLFTGIEDIVQLAGDIEMTLGGQLLAVSGGTHYRYLMDLRGARSPFEGTHAEDRNYFVLDPGSKDGSQTSIAEKTDLGIELRELWTSFAREGVPRSAAGTYTWPSVKDRDAAQPLGLPLLRLRLGAARVEHSAWFSDAAASLLAGIACGRVGIQDLGCAMTV